MKKTSETFPLILAIILIQGAFMSCSNEKGRERNKPEEVKITMSDGIELATDLYLPKGRGKYPAVLIRTPYGKHAENGTGKGFRLFNIAVVIQDVRGKNGSGGTFYPFVNERSDGLETLRWIREQPWSDGTVCGWGGSYVGITQWAVSDSLDYMFPLLTGGNLYDFIYPDSLFSHHSAYLWGVMNASSGTDTISPDKLRNMFNILPLSAADDSTVRDVGFLNDWIAHEKYDEYWDKIDFRDMNNATMISIAGWYDIFLKSQIDDFIKTEKRGNRDNRLIIGPWCHGPQGEKNEYGGKKKTGNPARIFLYARKLLKGKKAHLPKPLKDTRYNLFIMERNEYAGSQVWPPEDTRIVPYYIGPGSYIGTKRQYEQGELKYVYDPSDPFPAIGGTILGDSVGPARQNRNSSREDQLVFETDPFEEPLTLLGPISATLWVSSSTPCTDFIVGIQDVFPDGRIINIQEGGARIRMKAENEPFKTEISVWATGYQLNTGHRLRAFITSSLHPRYNRNLNDCQPIAHAIKPVAALQRVYYGDTMPSSINLPIFDK